MFAAPDDLWLLAGLILLQERTQLSKNTPCAVTHSECRAKNSKTAITHGSDLKLPSNESTSVRIVRYSRVRMSYFRISASGSISACSAC